MTTKIELKSCKKGYTYDQDKVIRPEETVKRALERINGYGVPLIKSFYRIKNYFNIPQYRIDCTLFIQNHSMNKQNITKGTNGKGAVEDQARASCIMEFVERFSVSMYDKWKKCWYNDFQGGEVLPAESIAATLNYDWNTDPDDLMEKLKSIPMSWAEAYNFTNGKSVYIPKLFLDACSTGLSAGNTLEEALLQAICECVERHSGACVQWYKQEYPTVDKSSIKNPVIIDLISKIEIQGMEVILKDFSGILGIPTMGVILLDKEYRDDIGQNIGVCCDKEKALVRALTEVVQGVKLRSNRMLKNRTVSYFFDNYEDVKYLLGGKNINFEDVLDIREDDIKVEIEKCMDILGRRGMEVMFVDLEEQKIKMPAVWVYLKNAFLAYSMKPLALYLGRTYLFYDQWDEALSNLEKIKDNEKTKNDLYFFSALAYKGKGEYRKAIEYLNKALKEVEDLPEREDDKGDSYLYKGMCYFELQDYDNAIKYYNKAKEIDENKDVIYFNMGIAYQSKKEYTTALENFNKVLEINPEFSELSNVYIVMGWCLLELNKFEKAIEKFNLAAEKDSNNKQIFLGRGLCYKKMENYNEAISNFEKIAILEQNQKNEEAAVDFNIGECYEALKKYDSAITYYEKALNIENDNRDFLFKLGLCCQSIGDCKKAIFYYNAVLEKGPQDKGELYLLMGSCYGILGEHDKAIEILKRAAGEAVDKEKIDAIKYNLGMEYQALGNHREALKYFEKGYEYSVNNITRGEIKYQIAYSKVNMDDKKGAKEALSEAMKYNPDKAEIYNLLGAIFMEEKNDDKAIEILNEGIRRSPGRWENYNLLGVCYRNKGNMAEAIKSLEEAIRMNPQEWRNYNILGSILLGIRENSRAREMLKKAMEYCTDSTYRDKIKKILDVT